MKFICTKENIARALGYVSALAGKQTNLPILTNVLIQASESGVTVMTTNLEMVIRANCRAKVDVPGSFTVPTKTLVDYIHFITDTQVDIEVKENELVVSGGGATTKIKGIPAEEFPVMPEMDKKHEFVFDGDQLKSMLGKTAIAVAKNEIRPELSGICAHFFSERFSGLLLAATDSYRLAEGRIAVKKGSDAVSCIIPSRTAFEIIRLLSVQKNEEDKKHEAQIFVGENHIGLRVGDVELTSRLIDGKYPDYAQIIPTAFKTTATVPVDTLVTKIKAASLFSTAGVNGVSFDLNASEKMLGISSTSTQTGEHSSLLDVDITGEENSILLNYRYVLDGLQQMNADVLFQVNSGDAPCVFRESGSSDYLYIVMPIRQ